jgi:hypothetical protein
MAADGTNGTAASELIEFVGTKINVQISNGAGVTVEDTLPAAVISSAQLLPTNLVFASSANLSVQATAHPEEFVVQAPVTGPGAAFTIAGFDATQDIVALPYAVFGSAPQILADTLATSGGALIASLNGTSQVLLAGITAGHLGASDFLPI